MEVVLLLRRYVAVLCSYYYPAYKSCAYACCLRRFLHMLSVYAFVQQRGYATLHCYQQPAFTLAPSLKFETKEQDLDTLEELGMGSGGTVFKVLHRAENTIMAKKIIHQIDERTSKAILRELQILNKCAHENIIAFYGAYMNQGELCICMEYVGSWAVVRRV